MKTDSEHNVAGSHDAMLKRYRQYLLLLQLLMDNNAQFRDKVQEELESQRVNMLDPIKKKLLSAISKVCTDKNLDYVIDTGSKAYLVINPEKGVDISSSVFSMLGIENTLESVPNRESGQAVIINQQTNK